MNTADLLCADLERIVNRIVRADAHLVLERESEPWFIVVDLANGDEVMCRADREVCVRFMRAFAEKHPEATVDLPAEYSVRVPPLAPVLPLRRPLEPVDEIA